MEIAQFQTLIQEQENVALRLALEDNSELAFASASQGISMLVFAAYCRNQEAIEILKVVKGDQLDFFESLICGEKDRVEGFLAKEPTFANTYYVDGFTPLGLAAFFGQEAIVDCLLKNGSDPNQIAQHPMQLAPIHSACAIAHLGIAQLLVNAGADVNVAQSSGVTPLHSAAHMGNLALVKLLVNKGANVLAKMEDGRTALDFAIGDGHKEVESFLKTLL